MSDISIKRASVVEMRKQLKIVDSMKKWGMRFVAVPVLNDADFLYLSSMALVRMNTLEKVIEKYGEQNE